MSLAVNVVCALMLLPALPEESLSHTRFSSRSPGSSPERLLSPTELPCFAGSNLHSMYWAPLHHEPAPQIQNKSPERYFISVTAVLYDILYMWNPNMNLYCHIISDLYLGFFRRSRKAALLKVKIFLPALQLYRHEFTFLSAWRLLCKKSQIVFIINVMNKQA